MTLIACGCVPRTGPKLRMGQRGQGKGQKHSSCNSLTLSRRLWLLLSHHESTRLTGCKLKYKRAKLTLPLEFCMHTHRMHKLICCGLLLCACFLSRSKRHTCCEQDCSTSSVNKSAICNGPIRLYTIRVS